jgi:GAF domain-containing protein
VHGPVVRSERRTQPIELATIGAAIGASVVAYYSPDPTSRGLVRGGQVGPAALSLPLWLPVREVLVSTVIDHRRVHRDDLTEGPGDDVSDLLRAAGFRSVVFQPVVSVGAGSSGTELLRGVLVAAQRQPEAWSGEQLARLAVFAAEIGVVGVADPPGSQAESRRRIEVGRRAFEIARRRRAVVDGIRSLGQRVATAPSLDEALGAALAVAVDLGGARTARVHLLDDGCPTGAGATAVQPTVPPRFSAQRFTLRPPAPPTWEDVDPATVAPEGFRFQALRTGTMVVVENLATDPLSWPEAEAGARGAVAVPLGSGSSALGVLVLDWFDRWSAPADDRRLLELLAAYVTSAVRNARRRAAATLRAHEVAAARLDGVLLTAGTAADRIGNDLTGIRMLLDLLRAQQRRGEPIDPDLLESIVDGARSGVRHLGDLLRVTRVATRAPSTLPPILDLDLACKPV